MDSSLKLIGKQFGFKVSEKRNGIRFSVSKTWKAGTRLTRRPNDSPSAPPSTQQATALPPELLDHILDYLHDDTAALRNCSLVCYALVPSARFHLFQKVKITHDNFVRATVIFAGNAPHLAEYVRDLTLELGIAIGGSSFDHLRNIQKKKPLPAHLRVFMLVLCPRMCNVTRLTLKDVAFDNTVVDMLAPNFPQLHTLSLFDCWFQSNADFHNLLRDRPQVRHLRCGRLSSLFGSWPPQPQQGIGSPISLRSLKITEAYSPSPLTLMPWLVMHSNPEHYTYTLYRLGQLTKLNHCLLGLSSLKHLHVIFYRWRTEDVEEVLNAPAVLSLIPRHPPTMATLTLDAKMHSALLVVSLLGQLDPHSFVRLQTVNLFVHLHEEDMRDVPLEMWARMDKTLSVLLSLGGVNIFNVCTDHSHVEDGKKAVLEVLPVLNARGILKFDQKQS